MSRRKPTRDIISTLTEWCDILEAREAVPILMIGGTNDGKEYCGVLCSVESVDERKALVILEEMVRRLRAKGVKP